MFLRPLTAYAQFSCENKLPSGLSHPLRIFFFFLEGEGWGLLQLNFTLMKRGRDGVCPIDTKAWSGGVSLENKGLAVDRAIVPKSLQA